LASRIAAGLADDKRGDERGSGVLGVRPADAGAARDEGLLERVLSARPATPHASSPHRILRCLWASVHADPERREVLFGRMPVSRLSAKKEGKRKGLVPALGSPSASTTRNRPDAAPGPAVGPARIDQARRRTDFIASLIG
jgi:hypothetical protein